VEPTAAVILAVPLAATAVMAPFASTLTTAGSLDVQVRPEEELALNVYLTS